MRYLLNTYLILLLSFPVIADDDDGDVGPQGAQGVAGINGTNGADGIDGLNGAQGVKGDAGTNGSKGDKGLPGITGTQGSAGEQGLTGTQGATGKDGLNGKDSQYEAGGLALSNALAQIDCDHSTKSWQVGIGAGFYDGETAISAGVCKRFNDTLIKTSFGEENGKYGGGVGIVWHFD